MTKKETVIQYQADERIIKMEKVLMRTNHFFLSEFVGDLILTNRRLIFVKDTKVSPYSLFNKEPLYIALGDIKTVNGIKEQDQLVVEYNDNNRISFRYLLNIEEWEGNIKSNVADARMGIEELLMYAI